jgi:hypothetical protein
MMQDARVLAEQGFRLAREGGARGAEVRALRLLGDVFATRECSDAKRSARCFTEGLLLGEELGISPQVARCHLGLAGLHVAVGKMGEAKQELVAALSMFNAMAMPLWAGKAVGAFTGLRDTPGE